MNITEARRDLANLVRRAKMLDEATVITQNGHEAAVLVSASTWRELDEIRRQARRAELLRRRDDPNTTWVPHADVITSVT